MDKSNIRTVIHLALPASVEAYLQESGRAGRDRKPCRAVLLYHPDDKNREAGNPRRELRERYETLVAFAEDHSRCRRESLLAILEAEPEDCDSCDVCRGEVRLQDQAGEQVREIVQAYKRRFTAASLGDFLLGRYSPEILQGGYERSPGFGVLASWDPDDVKEVVRGVVAAGKIVEMKRVGWRGRLMRSCPQSE